MKNIKWHLIVVLVYISVALLIDLYTYGKEIRLPLIFDVFLRQFWIIYSGFFALYVGFLARKKWRIFAIPIILLSAIGTYFFTQMYVVIHDLLYEKIEYSFKDKITSATESYVNYFLVSLGLFFLVRFLRKEKENKLLIEQQLEYEKKLSQSENDFLRAQINPHFLYNSLNYFYAETYNVVPKVGDAIVKLSDIMRYSLTDFAATDGLAMLEEELENIQNIIEINQGRFEGKFYIKLQVNGSTEGKRILPMLLLTLVENIFKHGDLQDETNPAIIDCSIDEANKQVTISTVNKISNAKKQQLPGGLGTENIRKRLQLLYQDKFVLQFSAETINYHAKMVIPYFETKHNYNND
jgi:two-component system, LytTR family, sensor kinase